MFFAKLLNGFAQLKNLESGISLLHLCMDNRVYMVRFKNIISIAIESISSILMFLFLYTGLSKMMAFEIFKNEIHNQVYPYWLKISIVYGLPGMECLLALLLFLGKTRMIGLYASFVLLGFFTIYSIAILANFFHRVPCSCGGLLSGLSWGQHLFFNLGLMIMSAIGIFLQTKISKMAKPL